MKTNEFAISIQNLNKTFFVYDSGASIIKKISKLLPFSKKEGIQVLKDINIDIPKGEFFGIIGKNGSGKSTLLKIIVGAIKADRGTKITTNGRLIRLALGIGFDVNLSARDNVYLNGTILGLSLRSIGEKFEEIINFAELQDFVDTPVRFYSSGMKSRLSFSIALHAEADILLIDEFFGAVGDNVFKEKSQRAFEEKILKGKTIIHVSHSMRNIKDHCDRVLVLKKGIGKIFNDSEEAIKFYSSTE